MPSLNTRARAASLRPQNRVINPPNRCDHRSTRVANIRTTTGQTDFYESPLTKPQVRAGSSDLPATGVLGRTDDWATQEAVDLDEDRHMSKMR